MAHSRADQFDKVPDTLFRDLSVKAKPWFRPPLPTRQKGVYYYPEDSFTELRDSSPPEKAPETISRHTPEKAPESLPRYSQEKALESSPRHTPHMALQTSPPSPGGFGALATRPGSRGRELFRAGPPPPPIAQSREARLSREEELDKELAERVRLHEEEAASEFPLRLPPTPSPRTLRTGLFDLMAHGLVDTDVFAQLQQVDEGTFLNEVIHLIQREKASEFFFRAFGAWMVRDTSHDVNAVDANVNMLEEMKELCQECMKTPRDIGFWSTVSRRTWVYMRNSREWTQYDQQAKATTADVHNKRQQFVEEHVAAFQQARAIDREAVVWDFNALFHYCGNNTILRSILPPLPWSHSEVEAREVIRRLTTVTFKKAIVPSEARLLKLFFVTSGKTDT